MKKILLLLLLFGFYKTYATEQIPDILFYGKEKLVLATGWGHPSPLQTYYRQNDLKYPFTMESTANYRGHVATWEIVDNKFFLRTIHADGTDNKPEKFNVKSKTDTVEVADSQVFADWFSGVLHCYAKKGAKSEKVNTDYYFYVRNGNVVNVQKIGRDDYNRIRNISEKDTSDHSLMDKYSMLILNNNYISYYFRLNDEDTIVIKNKGGYLSAGSDYGPLLQLYSNDHMKWPYNWENFEKSGAPHCKWVVDGDRIFLEQLELHTGTDFYRIDKHPISLDILFKEKIENGRVFGDWISGIYIVKYGKNKPDKLIPDYVTFKISGYTFLRIKEGIVEEAYTVSDKFNIGDPPKGTEPGLKKIIEELNKKHGREESSTE
ncbi:hypothetical protein LJB85_04265 [Porphyromonadaceae bacterium OttesenSCG-928-L07]|nr:hypothetical protein [Porphyromonadaceae bacterium OttesenSCG-928-L07]MDL2251494.1 hypothetical protein [Odoribacter sp. OttesenSCG-928-J03]MDL2283396.1 hypothetical protein [Odoribacter sp. OttesenSCG-928-G04]